MGETEITQKITVDPLGFIRINEVKLPCKLMPDGTLEFCDKDRRRSEKRGTRMIYVDICELAKLDKTIVTL